MRRPEGSFSDVILRRRIWKQGDGCQLTKPGDLGLRQRLLASGTEDSIRRLVQASARVSRARDIAYLDRPPLG